MSCNISSADFSASNSFSFIACSLIGFRNDKDHSYNAYCIWGYIWAALVSMSRVMMGHHFFGDIFVGMLFGLLVGALTGYLARYLILRFIDRTPVTRESLFRCRKAPVTGQE